MQQQVNSQTPAERLLKRGELYLLTASALTHGSQNTRIKLMTGTWSTLTIMYHAHFTYEGGKPTMDAVAWNPVTGEYWHYDQEIPTPVSQETAFDISCDWDGPVTLL